MMHLLMKNGQSIVLWQRPMATCCRCNCWEIICPCKVRLCLHQHNIMKCLILDIIFISESGIKTADDIDKLRKFNVDAVLIGETLMRSENKKQGLDELRGYKYE